MQSQSAPALVRLLIFSGQPDPEWALDEESRDQLAARLRDAVGNRKSNPPPPPQLGYRGFLVRPGTKERAALPEFTVWQGVLTVGSDSRAQHWQDVAGIEQMLLGQARERGLGEVLDYFGAGKEDQDQKPWMTR
jgi:hypothetical protein